MVIAAIGTVLAAAYLLWLYQRTAFGHPREEFSSGGAHSLSAGVGDHAADDHDSDIEDVRPTEWMAWTPFLIAIVVFGVYPQLMFKVMDPAVTQMVETLGKSLG